MTDVGSVELREVSESVNQAAPSNMQTFGVVDDFIDRQRACYAI